MNNSSYAEISPDMKSLQDILLRGSGAGHRFQNAVYSYEIVLPEDAPIKTISQPLVSVVIPVYKVEKYIHRCVNSVLAQTYPNLEIILVDDGSPDACPGICDVYAAENKNIKVIHKQNGGLSDARNAGIDAAEGYYIGFLDSDDWIEPDAYSQLVTAAELFDAEIAECGYLNEFSDHAQAEGTNSGVYVKADSHYALMSGIQWGVFKCNAWNKIYQRGLFSGNLRYPAGKLHEDEFFTHLVVAKCNKLVYVDRNLFHYDRTREDSITGTSFNESRLDALEALRNRADFFLKNGWFGLYATALDSYAAQAVNRLDLCKSEGISGKKVEALTSQLEDDIPKISTVGVPEHLIWQVNNVLGIKLEQYKEKELSVVIPVHNAAATLNKTIESLQAQSIGFNRIEIIVVENGSTDNSRHIIKELAEKHNNIRPLFLDQASGPGMARNKGLEIVATPYVMFLDADDQYLPNTCEILYGKIHGSEYDLVSGSYSIVDENGNLTEEFGPGHKGRQERAFTNVMQDIECWDYIRDAFWSKIYKTDIIRFYKIEFLSEGAAEDIWFLYRYLYYCKTVYFIPVPVYCYMINTSGDCSFMQGMPPKGFIKLAENYEKIFIMFSTWGKESLFQKVAEGILEHHTARLILSDSFTKSDIEDILKAWRWLFGKTEQGSVGPFGNVLYQNIIAGNFEAAAELAYTLKPACVKIEQLQAFLDRSNRDLSFLLEERDRTSRENTLLQEKLQNIENSRSWRLVLRIQKIYRKLHNPRGE